MKNLRTFLTLCIATTLFVSCDKDDDNSGNPSVDQKDGIIASQNDPDLDDSSDLKGDITADVTLAADRAWTLSGELRVKEGATLTIEPGTTIEAVAGGTNVFLAIEQGAKIDAQGTADSPIVITSNASNKRAGDWGGVVIAGRAPINTGATALSEVADITYGGDNPTDDSGIISYMILEYTGARINGTQEFNGFTFFGVGSGTTISNIMVNFGDDDGLEWFGGTVNVTNALVVNAKDDWFDWAEGWTGTATNLYGIREQGYNNTTEDPRGIEADSNANNNDVDPRSNPTINGLTLVHASSIEMADMIKIRRGSAAQISNALVAIIGEGLASDFIDLTDGSGSASGDTSITNLTGFNINIEDIANTVGATIEVIEGNAGGADVNALAWTGYTFPAIEIIE